jgi:hypothetical protein
MFLVSNRSKDMDWHERISVDPKVLVGKPVIKGTRIAVGFVAEGTEMRADGTRIIAFSLAWCQGTGWVASRCQGWFLVCR